MAEIGQDAVFVMVLLSFIFLSHTVNIIVANIITG